ncbi:MAG: Cof-type HAD-IIB family hydrolase [Clostridiales bacterium]|jgi:Cof subfamily protein (haloacid dehalogenase superfamily)|nr:Cof-type HAD-IIB family hydrolase [Clostridiales bacterium]
MLVSDLDNTLLSGGARISPEVKDAVAFAVSKGVRIVLCSGRCYLSMNIFEKALGLMSEDQLGISFNGGLIYESLSRKILTDYRLERGLAFDLIDGLKSRGASVLVYQGGDLYAEHKSADIMTYGKGAMLPVNILNDFRELSGDVSKILVRGEKGFIRRVEESLRDTAAGRCNAFFSADVLLEYCPLEADKGAGMEKVCAHYGISPEETIAVGDQNNDIPMLRLAGLGIAVANATEEAKAAADQVADATNDQNAAARIIYSYFADSLIH